METRNGRHVVFQCVGAAIIGCHIAHFSDGNSLIMKSQRLTNSQEAVDNITTQNDVKNIIILPVLSVFEPETEAGIYLAVTAHSGSNSENHFASRCCSAAFCR